MTSNWQVPYVEPGPAPGVAFASPGPRLAAYIVDIIIVTMVIILVAIVGGLATAVSFRGGAGAATVSSVVLLVFGILAVSLGYFPYFWAHDGSTPGMRMFGLRVVRDIDGGPISGGQAVLRLLGYWVSSIAFYLGFVWIFVDRRHRGWHDLIAGTVMIERR